MPLFTHPRYQRLELDRPSSSSEEAEGLIKSESPSSSPTSSNKSSYSLCPPLSSSNRGYYLLALTALFGLSLTFLTIAVLVILIRENHSNPSSFSSSSSSSSQSSPQGSKSTTHPPVYTSCGSSPTDALARGCKFDILSFAWQTPECYDEELMSEFLAYPLSQRLPASSPNADGWKFYTEYKTTDPSKRVDLETALKGERNLYVDWEFHVVHCTFMWRQMHRAFTVLGYVDGHLDNYGHTMHCQRTLLDKGRSAREVSVVAAVRYPECRPALGGGSERGSGAGFGRGYDGERKGEGGGGAGGGLRGGY